MRAEGELIRISSTLVPISKIVDTNIAEIEVGVAFVVIPHSNTTLSGLFVSSCTVKPTKNAKSLTP